MRLIPSAPASSQGLRDAHYIGDVGRELYDNRLFRDRLDGFGDLCRRAGICAEAHSAAVHVRTADVDLEPADLLLTVELFAGVGIFVDRKAADIRHDFFVKAFLEPRELLAYNLVHSGILEPDGVYHAGGALRYSRLWDCRSAAPLSCP